jgi:hypothetical protein
MAGRTKRVDELSTVPGAKPKVPGKPDGFPDTVKSLFGLKIEMFTSYPLSINISEAGLVATCRGLVLSATPAPAKDFNWIPIPLDRYPSVASKAPLSRKVKMIKESLENELLNFLMSVCFNILNITKSNV